MKQAINKLRLRQHKRTKVKQQTDIPRHELDEAIRRINEHPEYFDVSYLISRHKEHCSEVIPDPFSKKLIALIQQALVNKSPLSVIRIGDGEANILTYNQYPETPRLNQHAAEKIILNQPDSFKVSPLWLDILQNSMQQALEQADIIGVLGIRQQHAPKIEEVIRDFTKDYRGISGQWRGRDYILRLAECGTFQNKTLASAHLYFTILENLHDLLQATNHVTVLTNRESILKKLRSRYPQHSIEHIAVGQSGKAPRREEPDFLQAVHDQLPGDMRGMLGLVGAGPWSEIYCTWIKQRGGVAVDVGSGFDLLAGELSRPIHDKYGAEKMLRYSL